VAHRIVLFGATGYSGELTARALVRRGQRPVLAGRNGGRLQRLADELGGLDTALADVARPASVADLVEAGDVLISTVGPFSRRGGPALAAAVGVGAHYLDSTGEPPFIRDVFEKWDGPARAAGSALLPAMAYDYVPGNLAAALALRDAGPTATRVEVGYFFTGPARRSGMSGGTVASLAAVLFEPGFALRGGVVVQEPAGQRKRRFVVGGAQRAGVSIGGSEHYALRPTFPSLRDVDVFLGWFGGGMPKPVSVLTGALFSLSPVRKAGDLVTARLFRGSSGGPDAAQRARYRSVAIAETFDAAGQRLDRAVVEGVGPYDFTGEMLAWAAERIVRVGVRSTGALGPVAAFGLDELTEGVREAGLVRTA
jgi:short subunit dehydrogenase-like uncharacterized protein